MLFFFKGRDMEKIRTVMLAEAEFSEHIVIGARIHPKTVQCSKDDDGEFIELGMSPSFVCSFSLCFRLLQAGCADAFF